MSIKLLPSHIVNQIAAGEVVERPAAAIKELVENSLDAGASKIDIAILNGGKTYISISDDGSGISQEELPMALTRHATSKLNTDDLFDINFLGFRGEALPSIASVSRLKIISKVANKDAYEINVNGGKMGEVIPSSLNKGTRIEVRDLFYSVPARLKFLKTDGTESSHIVDVINRIALCYPLVSFSLSIDNKQKLLYSSTSPEERISQIMGTDFINNMRKIEWQNGDFILSGYVSLPTFTKGTSTSQYMFINGRSIKDKLLYGSIRAGFEGYIGRDIYPACVIFLQLPTKEVDVNVHPAKTEVRFREASMVRGCIIAAIKRMLEENSGVVASTVKEDAISSFMKSNIKQHSFNYNPNYLPSSNYTSSPSIVREFSSPPIYKQDFSQSLDIASSCEKEEENFPLGFARAQLHSTYIIAETDDSITIVDQHAAHERLTYEKLTQSFEKQNIPTQILLIPEIVDLEINRYEAIIKWIEDFKKIGIIIDKFGESSIIVREMPQLLGQVDIKSLIYEVADGIIELGTNIVIREKLKDICAIMSCHGSIRAGRKLGIEEMNALLREIEANPNTAQCIHGRPTYIKLELKDIEKLFGRR